ncbi:hypothetical protein HB364_27135 [Pseudoflavitalea sp. X16]|uniref:S41 family peptidase n=1 Tax=Paraflavitalea devenefica TaxID=2716334 RepID=UPI0014240200|nr:S41 family peptidase [Paraflavitalea devenefica]NII28786.1 hypothetical protein [Paraflavitalea devenefica]
MQRRLKTLLFIAISIGAGILHAPAQTPGTTGKHLTENPAPLPGSLTTDQMQADFDTLRKALEEVHGGLYRFSTKPAINHLFDSCRARLNSIHSQRAFMILLFEMLAQLRDGHMRLEADAATTAALAQARLFPLRLMLEGDRLMVLYNDTPGDSTIRPGMELLTVNGHRAAHIIHTILPGISGDGFIETFKRKRLERSFAPFYWLYVDQATAFSITAKDNTGNTITTTLPGILNAAREQNRAGNPVNTPIITNLARLDSAKDNVSLRFINNTDLACLRIRTFGGDAFISTLDLVFQTLHDKKTKALILDLRGNGGGVDEYGAALVSQLTNKPFRYFDRIHLTSILPSFTSWKPGTVENLRNGVVTDPKGGYLVTPQLHTGVGGQNPAARPFTGKLFVLLDGGTFSTAADVTALLRHLTNATFIGEESGGAAEGNTSGLNALVKLPHSKLSLKIHLYEYWNAIPPGKKGRGTLPDHAVETHVADWLQGIDAPMKRALLLATTSKF